MEKKDQKKCPVELTFCSQVSNCFICRNCFLSLCISTTVLPQMGSDFHLVIYLDLVHFSIMKPSDLNKIPTLLYNILPQEENGYFCRGMTVKVSVPPGTFVSVTGGDDNSAGRTDTYWDCTGQIQMCGPPTYGSQRTVNKITFSK